MNYVTFNRTRVKLDRFESNKEENMESLGELRVTEAIMITQLPETRNILDLLEGERSA